MNIIRIKILRLMNPIKIKKRPRHAKGGGGCRPPPPPPPPPPACMFSGGGAPKSDQIFESSLKVVPGPFEAFLVAFLD